MDTHAVRDLRAEPLSRWRKLVLPGLVSLALVGCSASWKAPVETRSPQPAGKPRSAQTLQGVGAYRVVSGDTLYGIAWRSGVDYRHIARWNDLLPPYRIYVGQTLHLRPPSHAKAPQAAKVSKPSARTQPVPRSADASSVSTASDTVAPRRQDTHKPPHAKPASAAAVPAESAAADAASSRELRWGWPASGRVVATYDAKEPLAQGIKISGRAGDSIRAAESGKVVYSGSGLIGYGRLIIVKHNDNYLSAYGHNREILVSEGDQVTKGQQIAKMGTAGDGGPLLHFEIRRNGKPVNPARYLPKR